jgi:uncharacterized protein with HEPN domain
MPQRDPQIPLRHRLDHAREALALTQGKSEAEVLADRVLCLALIRLLEVIGEAANRVPAPERLQHPGIPWRQIVSLRHRLIHGYDTVNMQILWQIIVSDLPPLVTALEAALPPTGMSDSSPAR